MGHKMPQPMPKDSKPVLSVPPPKRILSMNKPNILDAELVFTCPKCGDRTKIIVNTPNE